MPKMLAIVSAASLLLCGLFLGLAHAIGGDDVFHDQRSLGRIKPLIDLATHKEWRWEGGDTLALDTRSISATSRTAPACFGDRPCGADGACPRRERADRFGRGRRGAGRQAAGSGGQRRGPSQVRGQWRRKPPAWPYRSAGPGPVHQWQRRGERRRQGFDSEACDFRVRQGGPGRPFGGRRQSLDPGQRHGDLVAAWRPAFIAGSGKRPSTRPAHLRQTILGSGDVSARSRRGGSGSGHCQQSSPPRLRPPHHHQLWPRRGWMRRIAP